jgi:hypothetical protein
MCQCTQRLMVSRFLQPILFHKATIGWTKMVVQPKTTLFMTPTSLFGKAARSLDFPLKITVFPSGTRSFPTGKRVLLKGIGRFPTGITVFPLGIMRMPKGTRSFPTGTDSFPVGNEVFPSGIRAFPIGIGRFPTGNLHFSTSETQLVRRPGPESSKNFRRFTAFARTSFPIRESSFR